MKRLEELVLERPDKGKELSGPLPMLVPALAVLGLVVLLALLAWLVSTRWGPGVP